MIAHSFDEASSKVQSLVNDFRQNEAHFLSTQYSEPRVREDFINKFWMALGWDVTHSEQKNPYEQEVTVEKNVNVEGRGKRADYAFTVAPHFRDVSFFVEAKKPSRNIDNADDYFQTVRYGWNARTSVAVLTDFEQFRVLDCRYEPDIDSVLSYGAIEKFHYTDYTDPEKFRRIYHLFSRAEVAGGSLARYAEGLPKPSARGQRALIVTGRFKSVDESFLQKLDEYRERLAQTFKRNNPQLESLELTEVTQRTLDRLVFMRFLEDKLIETSELVQKLADSARPWREFVATSRKLNATYNGIIFKEHSLLDGADFAVDERAFVDICASLSYARSPYNFNYIPVHILGSIYERFLGKTIVVADAEASVQDKPEVRKAGGVYYTPEYIVRYIVENTVGQLIDEKKPEEISAMRFADISCGSGSFLIGVYDLLLRYHRTYYNANKKRRTEGRRAGCVELPDGTLQLSLKQKRAILTNNIYGVDIDAQAVEVAQLSLYLKLLEEETTASARLYQIELGEKLLPSLSKNIISGNSLIDWDIEQGHLFDKDERRKLNPMSFKDEFSQIMKDGGFDAVVGNPPYVLLQDEFRDDNQLSYFRAKYQAASYKIDTYHLFMEKGMRLIKENGLCSMITPANFLTNNYLAQLRRLMLEAFSIKNILVIEKGVFAGISVDNAIFITSPKEGQAKTFQIIHSLPKGNVLEEIKKTDISIDRALADEHVLFTGASSKEQSDLWKRIGLKSRSLGEIASVNFGKQLRDRAKYPNDVITVNSETAIPRTHRPCYTGRDVTRYGVRWGYLACFNDESARSGGCWDARKQDTKNKLLTRQIGRYPDFALDERGYQCLNTMFMINIEDSSISPKFVLAVLNSKLTRFLWLDRFYDQRRTFPKIKGTYLKQLPIPLINPNEQSQYDQSVQLVEQMLDAKKQLAEAVTDRDRNLYERKCANLDRQIDELVYELYGLSKEEIALVEASQF